MEEERECGAGEGGARQETEEEREEGAEESEGPVSGKSESQKDHSRARSLCIGSTVERSVLGSPLRLPCAA